MSHFPDYNRILVIGATSGLGNGIARRFACRGCQVVVCGRRQKQLQELVDEFPHSVTMAPLDVNAPDATDRLGQILSTYPDIDLIINCAGIGYNNPDLDTDKDIATVTTDCLGFTAVCDTAFNYLANRAKGGQLVAISSVAATRPLGMAVSYSASKRFQASYLEGLDQLSRLRHLPVKVTDIRPGFTRTDLLDPTRRYPMLMEPDKVVIKVVNAIDRRRRVAIIDWRWRVLVALWRLIPHCLWVRLPVKSTL